MTFQLSYTRRAAILLVLLAIASPVTAQWIVPPTPADQVNVTVTPTVTYDNATGLYTYDYKLTSGRRSAQNVSVFALQVEGDGTAGNTPTGWTFGEYQTQPIVEWAATEAAPDPPDFVDDGGLPPLLYPIRPGSSMSGFRFISPDPPGRVSYYVQGEVPLPVLAEDADADDAGLPDDDISVNSVHGMTTGPVPLDGAIFEGGRPRATDGFLVFLNLNRRTVKSTPASIIVKFSLRGETVDRSTFRARLNGVDVTRKFLAVAAPGDLGALFKLGKSPLRRGDNVLWTSVKGIVPGTDRTARDIDQIVFKVR